MGFSDGPGYWMHESGPVLKPAVTAYLEGRPLDDRQIAAIRAYVRQWIAAPAWRGPLIDPLRTAVDEITDRTDIDRWREIGFCAGLDPF